MKPAPPGWQVDLPATLRNERQFASYSEAAAFVTRLALLAERLNHHPDIHWQYTRVTTRLTTHDADKITELDHQFAAVVNGWFA